MIPAVSSVALAFARLGLDWDDALVLSAHGREPRPVIAAALAHPKVAILTEPGAAAAQLAGGLLAAGRRVYAARAARRARTSASPNLPAGGAAGPAGPGSLADPHVLVAVDPATADPAAAGDPAASSPADSRTGHGAGLGGRAPRCPGGLGAAG